jgi:peptidoglycan lytic transglycosylase
VGSSGKHSVKTPPRLNSILTAATVAAAVTATAAWAMTSANDRSQTRSTAVGARPGGHPPGSADRDGVRAPLTGAGAAASAPDAAEPVSKATRSARKTRHRLRVRSSGVCQASYYGGGQRTASGEYFNPRALTAAHRTLPMDSRVRVTNQATGRSVTVRINDRGPFTSGRCLDLSLAAMKAVGGVGSGVITARYEVLA